MAKTDSFRAQHKEIAGLVGEIESKLNSAALSANAEDARKALMSLTGKLMVHLAMEDKSLYPAMLSSPNAEAKKTAEDFMKEMGTIGGVFKAYVDAWSTGTKIKDKPDDFIKQTKEVFTALKKRVEREENVLYKMADSL